ncbi:TonB-dependent receptor [candidate division KSB1 bacterium]|nr:TonB-dependent receptor [candidate division KSB1 bacterium]
MFALTISPANGQSAKSKIVGKIVDAQTGDPLIGANVYLDGTMLGAACDIDGNFSINAIPVGTYTIIITMMGYQKTTITDVVVKPGEVTTINTTLSSEVLASEEVVVTAKAVRNTDAALLKDRQKSTAVSDAISAETISQTGAGDAASAMKKVTGASVVGGKYIYIRGLGERYSSTMLNGAELPSADPDKKSFQLDLFPSSLLDNIVTLKTFTPDKPGTFSGGLVDVTTKDFPEKFTFTFSTSTSYNSATTFNDHFILPNKGGYDWLGMDDGTRAIPSDIPSVDGNIPRYTDTQTSQNPNRKADAIYLDHLSKSFNNIMAPIPADALMNQGFSISTGNQHNVGTQNIGYLASLTWGQNYSFYENGEVGRFKAPGMLADLSGLDPQFNLKDTQGSYEARWGGMANLAYKNPFIGQISGSYMRTQSGESSARFLEGSWKDIPSTATYQTRVLSYIERSLNTFQLEGKHAIKPFFNARIDWKSSYSVNKQDEPDLRFFSNHYTVKKSTGVITYQSPASLYPAPIRYFRNLEENNFNNNLDIEMPFKQWNSFNSKLKFGGNYTKINREYSQRRFEYEEDQLSFKTYTQENGPDINGYFSQVGLSDTTGSSDPIYWDFSQVITESKSPKNIFTGEQTTSSAYVMIDMPLTVALRFVGGVRYEQTDMIGKSADESLPVGELNNSDWLPSINLVYTLRNNMNLRFAYTHTLARPTFRELAPYTNFEFVGDYSFQGNVNLQRTLIQNIDIRWEWFLNPGEIMAVSGFYKNFDNPIERFLDDSQPNLYYSVMNVDNAKVYGIEFEIRKQLDQLHHYLRNLNVGTNFSYVHSATDIPKADYDVIVLSDPNTEKTRPFQGQSPYLFNFDLSYNNFEHGLNAGLFYNIFGNRLYLVTRGASPDVYERAFGTLDFKLSKNLFKHYTLSFAAKNLLDPDVKYSQEFNGKEYNYLKYKRGVTYAVSIGVKM